MLIAIFAAIVCVGFFVGQLGRIGIGLIHQLLQEGSAPTASGSRSVAFGQLARYLWPAGADELNDFSPGDVEAHAEFVIVMHHWLRE